MDRHRSVSIARYLLFIKYRLSAASRGRIILFIQMLGAALSATTAQGVPLSKVDGDNRVVELYESDAQGKATERPPAVTLPFRPKPGYLVINEKGTQDIARQDPKTWSDILLFTEDTVQLFSDPFIFKGEANADVPFSAMDVKDSKFDGAALAGGTQYTLEAGPPTVYMPKREQPFQGIFGGPGDSANGVQWTYNIYSPIPETLGSFLPATTFLMLCVAGVNGRGRSRSSLSTEL